MQTFASAEKKSARPLRPARQGRDDSRCARAQAGAVQELLKSTGVQARLEVGAPEDALEREADRAADRVMSMPRALADDPPAPQSVGVQVQRKCARCARGADAEDEELLQTRRIPGEAVHLAPGQALRLGRSGGSGQPLSGPERAFFEPRFGHDFSGVRLHQDAAAARAAHGLGARAFTHGRDIVFGAGMGNQADRWLLAHELAHVIQQGQASPLPRSASASASVSSLSVEGADAARETGAAVAPEPAPASVSISRESAGPGTIQRDLLDDFVDDPLGTAWDTSGDVGSAAWDVAGDAGSAAWDLAGDAGEAVLDAGEAALDFAGDTFDALGEAGRAAWELAQGLASALGVEVRISGTRLIIETPEIQVCPEDLLSFQFDLPSIGGMIPIVEGILPVSGIVNLYGAFGINLALTPEIGIQLGPCHLKRARIVIDPLAPGFSAAGGFAVTTASSLGATVDAAARGEVGVLIVIPDPPIPIQIPVAGIEAGLTGQVRGIGGETLDTDIVFSYAAGTFSVDVDMDQVIGLAADLGLGAYGALDLLGQTLCRLHWPLWEWHGDLGLQVQVSAHLSLGRSGVSASLSATATQLADFPLDEVPLALSREVLEDDCPLCDAFHAMGVMPSQRGGSWMGHPVPPWGGPLLVYPRDPGIASGARCRGACGPDCRTCHGEGESIEKRVCEEQGDFHLWHVYPNHVVCDTHDGCRQHDACYDWCAAGGESTILGPCHRLCDFECLCTHDAPSCVGWIFGSGGNAQMAFSDPPWTEPGCRGPCPQEAEAGSDEDGEGAGGSLWETCLDPYPLLAQRHEYPLGPYHWSTGNIALWEQLVWDLPPVTAELYARGEADAGLNLGLGPILLTDLCLAHDPVSGGYRGTAALTLDAFGEGVLGLNGVLGGGLDLASLDFLRMACAEGHLRGEARPRVDLAGRLDSRMQSGGFEDGRVPVTCEGGDLTMDTGLTVTLDLSLTLALSAGARVQLGFFDPLRFEVWNGGPWELAGQTWETGWEVTIDLPPLAAGIMPAAAVSASALDLDGLLTWLLNRINEEEVQGGTPEDPELPGCAGTPPPPDRLPPAGAPSCEEVIEDPLTAARARQLDSLSGRINDPDWESATFTIPTGGSEEVGTRMEVLYLAAPTPNGSETNPRIQPDIYGFRKLPTRRAVGNRGFKRVAYVKGHLLNAKLDGPATNENLYPITEQANNPDHLNQVERHVKRLVLNDRVLVYYEVDVVDRQTPRAIDVNNDGTCLYYYSDAEFDCSWATYRLCRDASGGELVERNPTQNRQIQSAFDLNDFIHKVRNLGCPEAS